MIFQILSKPKSEPVSMHHLLGYEIYKYDLFLDPIYITALTSARFPQGFPGYTFQYG